MLHNAGMGTLLMDLLTSQEESSTRIDSISDSAEKPSVHSSRASGRTEQPLKSSEIFPFMLSLLKQALQAAVTFGATVGAVVSRGGRPDLAIAALDRVESPHATHRGRSQRRGYRTEPASL
jgi:hypothetical protein